MAASPEIHRVRRLFVNAYLVEEEDGLTLVDTLIPGSGKRILAAANKLGKPIRRIALTHAHGDHIGSLDELVDALGEAEVIVSAREARLLEKDASLDPDEPRERLRGRLPGARTKPTRKVEPGERVGSLEVVACPGHTPGHIAFLDLRDRTLYCGDALGTTGGVTTAARSSLRAPVAALFTWHRPTALASAKALASARSGAPGKRSRARARGSGRQARPRDRQGRAKLTRIASRLPIRAPEPGSPEVYAGCR